MTLSKYLEKNIRFEHLCYFNILATVGVVVVGLFRLDEIIANPWYMNRVESFWGDQILTNYF